MRSLEIFSIDFIGISVINCYQLSMMGIGFEIIGGLFLSMEAIGLNRFTNFYKFFYKLSAWGRKSLFRMSMILFLFSILMFGPVFINSRTLKALWIPIVCFGYIIVAILDHPDWYENWVIYKTKQGKISPIGFLIIVFGNLLQLFGLIWQMSLDN